MCSWKCLIETRLSWSRSLPLPFVYDRLVSDVSVVYVRAIACVRVCVCVCAVASEEEEQHGRTRRHPARDADALA